MNIKRISILVLSVIMVIFSSLALTACGSNKITDTTDTTNIEKESKSDIYPMTIKDSFGREVVIEAEPQKVISLSPVITETIFELGVSDKLIARTDFCNYPQEVSGIDSIGGLQAPNIEKMTALSPDLIIASAHFQEEVLKKLESAGLKVIILYGEESFDGVYSTIQDVGKVLNADKKAEDIVNAMKDKVESVKSKVEGKDTPSVYYVTWFGEGGDYTATKETFIAQLIRMAGGKNAADDAEGWAYSLEKLTKNNPDIMISSLYDKHKEQLKVAPVYKDLDAVKNDKLYEIDKDLIERQGPRLADGLEQVARIIHPEAFK